MLLNPKPLNPINTLNPKLESQTRTPKTAGQTRQDVLLREASVVKCEVILFFPMVHYYIYTIIMLGAAVTGVCLSLIQEYGVFPDPRRTQRHCRNW